MGGRALVAGFGAAAQVFLAAFLAASAGMAGHARAEVQPEGLGTPSPNVVAEAPASAGQEPSSAPADDSDISASPVPASSGEDEPSASPALDPESEAGGEPADTTETITASPGDDAATPASGAVVPPSDAEPPSADAAAVTPEEETKPAETAAPPTPPAEDATTKAADQGPTAVDPVVAAIKTMLEDPALRKAVASDDLSALEGFYGESNRTPLWITSMGFSAKAQALIAVIQNAGDWGLPAFDLPPASDLPATIEAQASDEIKLSAAALKYARFARGGRLSPTRISNLFDQKPDLSDPKTVLTEIAAAPAPATYLTSLHPKHDQFERLHATLIKAVASAKAHGRKPSADPVIQRLIVNMERWRWMPADLGSYYVWNNIPAFTARVVKDGKSIYVEKTIVGQLKYATPIFSADMRSIVFNPEWVVPDTIKIEDLQPRLRQGVSRGAPDTSILRDNKLSVSYQGRPIDAETVDWQRANIHQYTFTQPPGPDNVLGVLKFNFPNQHAVYMHDTLQPELFNQIERTLSHGCIRLRQPDRLAALLLAKDKGWPEERVKSLLAKGENSVVQLAQPIPVHLTYFTMAFDGVGKLQTFADVYGLDAKMAAVLFGKSDAIAADIGAERQKRSASNGGSFGSISGLFGN